MALSGQSFLMFRQISISKTVDAVLRKHFNKSVSVVVILYR
jgi:hypothetical protein